MLTFGQVGDNFSDGDFTNNPTWVGDVSEFEVNSTFQLHLNAPATTNESYLSLPLSLAATSEWVFTVAMDFNPSGSNLFQFHLISDSSNLESEHNGYFVQVGGTDDEVSLYRKDGATHTLIIDGIDERLDLDPVNVRVKVIRSSTGDWQLYSTLDTDTFDFHEGSTTDATYVGLGNCGLLCDYTSTRSTLFQFDDFGYNSPPMITELEVLDANTLVVIFNESLETSSAALASNYTVDSGIGVASSATLTSTNSVELSFATAFSLATLYSLTVSNVSDTLGNAISTETGAFEYLNYGVAGLRDIVINEIMADPSPAVGMPEIEFVEIYNTSSNYFDLSGAEFGDQSTTGSVPAGNNIAPDSYIILCDDSDTASFSAFGKVIGLPTFPGLNNAGDELSLFVGGVLVDRVTYTESWYAETSKSDGGYTLEQINPTSPCSGANNWIASDDASGGTPGQENSVYDTTPDTSPPTILDYNLSASSIELMFSKTMDSASLATATYTIDNGITVSGISVAPLTFNGVTLSFTAPVDSSLLYTLTINSGVTDCIGNELGTDTVTFGIGASPLPFDLIINELYPDPDETSAIPAAEYVEIYNRSEKLILLDGLILTDGSSDAYVSGVVLKPNSYAIICDDGFESQFESYGIVATVGSMPSLNNAGDAVSLRLGESNIDVVNYSNLWYRDDEKDAGGYSLERIDPNNLCGLSENWAASNNDDGGTPGSENSIYSESTLTSPVLSGVLFQSLNEVILLFDRKMDSLSLTQVNVLGGSQVYSSQSVYKNGTGLMLSADIPFSRGQLYTFQLDAVDDCAGLSALDLTIEQYLHDSADIVINELLSNPIESGSDFVELFNQSSYEINLQNWSLGYLDSKDSLRFNQISSIVSNLGAEEYVALNEDPNNIITTYPVAVGSWLLEMNLPSYPNESGTVLLYDQLGSIMETFEYSADLHFDLIDNQDGVSLERLDPERSTEDASNWHSASSSVGYATPGYVNSQKYASATVSEGFVLSSDYVSPDNDGYQDVVNIDYVNGETGTVAAVNVYNSKGMLIREVASNLLLGSNGSITWDGTNDSGEKARTGIHIILVETYTLDGERLRYRLPVIVASKL